ncbi:Lrp/AsnC family transcriptional regulator [Pseudomonas typographi]|uniref:Lrp/AsnC family transcriptional regulator n=1 Tax=Pseudomonas typographi TaxID=2715964 RepID=UPI0030B891A7
MTHRSWMVNHPKEASSTDDSSDYSAEESMELDNKDRQILEALQKNARQSLASLGKRIGLSQPAMSGKRTGNTPCAGQPGIH